MSGELASLLEEIELDLLDKVTLEKRLLMRLRKHGVLVKQETDQIQAERTHEGKINKLVDLLRRKPDDDLRKIHKALLEDSQPHVAALFLVQNAGVAPGPEDRGPPRNDVGEKMVPFLLEKRAYLSQKMTLGGQFLNTLVGNGGITKEQYDTVEGTVGTARQKVEVLLNIISKRRKDDQKKFFKTLKYDEDESGAAVVLDAMDPDLHQYIFGS